MMLANSLRRIWSAKNRGPRQTGRGQSGIENSLDYGTESWVWERFRGELRARFFLLLILFRTILSV